MEIKNFRVNANKTYIWVTMIGSLILASVMCAFFYKRGMIKGMKYQLDIYKEILWKYYCRDLIRDKERLIEYYNQHQTTKGFIIRNPETKEDITFE